MNNTQFGGLTQKSKNQVPAASEAIKSSSKPVVSYSGTQQNELLAALPAPSAHPGLYRRLRAGFDRARLARLAAGRGFDPPGPFATLLRAWRLARAR